MSRSPASLSSSLALASPSRRLQRASVTYPQERVERVEREENAREINSRERERGRLVGLESFARAALCDIKGGSRCCICECLALDWLQGNWVGFGDVD